MDPEVHVASMVLYFGVGVRSSVVEKLLEALAYIGPGRGGHCSSNGSDSDQHGVVYCACVEEEHADYFLTEFFLGGGERGIGIYHFCILYEFSVLGAIPSVW